MRQVIGTFGTAPLVLMDSISTIGRADRGAVVVSGSHGGSAAGRFAIAHHPLLVVFNDAGVGKDRAGILALGQLDTAGIAAVAVAHDSARIGDAADTWESGIVSYVNETAADMGLRAGDRLKHALSE